MWHKRISRFRFTHLTTHIRFAQAHISISFYSSRHAYSLHTSAYLDFTLLISPRIFASLRFAHIRLSPHIKMYKNTQGSINSSLGLFIHFYAWLVTKLHSHLLCNFFCKVLFLLLDTFTCLKTNKLL